MSKKILLVNTNTCSIAKIYPIGLDYLSSMLIENNYKLDKLDLSFLSSSIHAKLIKENIKKNNYLAIGISIRNLYDEIENGKNYLPEIIKLIKKTKYYIRKYDKKTKIILGGPGFSLLPNVILEESKADYGVIGEGEQATLKLLQDIQKNENLDKKIYMCPVNLSNIEYKRGSWGNFHNYFKSLSSGNLQTKRGCPFNCLYCECPIIEGNRFRFRNPEIVAEEFLQLEKLGFKKIYIVDATFNNPTYQAKDILKALKKAKTKTPWTAFFNPRLLDQELIELVKETNGAMPLKLTVESGSNLMLKRLQKKFTREDIEKAVDLCHKNKIDFSFTLLFGGPGETTRTINESIELINKSKPAYVSISIGVFIHPKTPIANKSIGKLWTNEKNFLKPIIYPCEKDKIKEQIEKGLSSTGINYRIYKGGE
jgi:radical SAM superfamily enzyme YgiQ (UPF0313 family)